MNTLTDYVGVFDSIKPWAGDVPAGFRPDFLGNMTNLRYEGLLTDPYHPLRSSSYYLQTVAPVPGVSPDNNGEFWFEAANWVLAALDARDRYVMATLGASFGYQAVGSHRALQMLNPMPCKLIAIDPVAQNIEWARCHMLDNGINPDEHWLVQAAISDSNNPVFFPVGAPGTGTQNCVATNEIRAREAYVRELVQQGAAEEALRNLLLYNTTGLTTDLLPGRNFMAEIKLVSAVTLSDILGPFDLVDYLEADMQQSEIIVFPPFIDLLKKKVRRIHIGTHGQDVHWTLHELFASRDWEIVFSYEPDATHESGLGTFKTCDGVLTVRNPTL